MCVGVGQTAILADTMRAMDLDCIVYDLQCHARRINLNHRNILLRVLEAPLIRHSGCQVTKHSTTREVELCLGKSLQDRVLLYQPSAKRVPIPRAMNYRFHSILSLADRAHTMMNAARPKPSLGYLKPPALAKDDV